ncbi:MAG: hypothetical protein GY696_30985 [Gammaproteobacteria bacterium]|nr:hypothetical protein [Gammaproteobacteria bacterium]
MVQQKYVSPKEFFKMYHDDSTDLMGWEMVGDWENDQSATMLVRYRMMDGFLKPSANTNVVLAAYVTSHVRLRLYSYLEKLQDRVLYFDTGKNIIILRNFDFGVIYACFWIVATFTYQYIFFNF